MDCEITYFFEDCDKRMKIERFLKAAALPLL